MFDRIHYDQRYVSLLEVYRCRSFTAAAGTLSLTSSAVAQQIHSVEKELDTSLFRRSEKQLIPTKECEIVVKYIEKIQSMCRRMCRDVETSKRRMEHLAVGITPSAENFALAGMLKNLSESSLQVTVTSGGAPKLCEMVKNFALDLAVIEGSCDMENLNELILDTDFLSVIVPPESKYAKVGMIRPAELMRESLIMKPSDSGTRILFEASLASAGIAAEQLNIMMEVENIATIIKLVAGNYGLSVLSHKACERDVARGVIAAVPLYGIGMSRIIRIIYRKNHDMHEILEELQRCYKESARDTET